MGEHDMKGYYSIGWTRAQEAFPGKTLFGDGITPDDIDQ